MKNILILLSAILIADALADETKSWSHPLGLETGLWQGAELNCDEGLQSGSAINGPQLFAAALDCFESDLQIEGAFLLIAGQIRSATDMALLRPETDIDEVAMGELATALFYQFGGAGPKEPYRDPVSSDWLFEKLSQFHPEIYGNYNPGWNYRDSSRVHLYNAVAEEQRDHRITQLQSFTRLLRDPEYWAADQERTRILERNGGILSFGTEDYERAEQLRKLMLEISQAQEQEAPSFSPSVLDEYVPDPDAPFVQVHAGLNGPKEFSRETYYSEEELLASWVADAISTQKLAELINRVDFSGQVIVALASGRRANASGRFHITDVSYNSLLESWSIYGTVGVNQDGCNRPAEESYPFAVAIADAPAKKPITSGGGISNFPDECLDLSEGEPN